MWLFTFVGGEGEPGGRTQHQGGLGDDHLGSAARVAYDFATQSTVMAVLEEKGGGGGGEGEG